MSQRPDWKPWYQEIGGSLLSIFWAVVIIVIVVTGGALLATLLRAIWMFVRFVWAGVLW